MYSNIFSSLRRNLNSKTLMIPSILFSYYSIKNNRLNCENNFTKIHLKDLNLNNGEMKEIKVGSTDKESILIVKHNGVLHALSNYCPHFGAPMSTGVLIDNVIKCPWHGASFDIISGQCDIGPSIDGLNKYEIQEENGEFYAMVDMSTIKKGKKADMAKRDPTNETHYVILGGGPASLSAAETLRSSGFTVGLFNLGKDYYLHRSRVLSL
jgi:nitrite reductase/ring-hydroxylating ferredoxin subunit